MDKLKWIEEKAKEEADRLYEYWKLNQHPHGEAIRREIQELNRVAYVRGEMLRRPCKNLFDNLKIRINYRFRRFYAAIRLKKLER